MSTHQEHFSRKFYQDKKTGYWISTDYSRENPRIRAHQWMWINHHGKPPKGYHVHHINDNKSDNSIENLELIHGRRHLSYHSKLLMKDPVRLKKQIEHCEKIRPMTKEWHGSQEGRAWHKFHGLRTWKERKSFKIICKACGKEAETKTFHQEFCTNACKSRWRRKSGLDDIQTECKKCARIFTKNKYSKQIYCCRRCPTSPLPK
jgi:hypothetical protein